MPWNSDWILDHEKQCIIPSPSNSTIDQQSDVIAKTLDAARKYGRFEILKKWRDELYPVGKSRHSKISMERSASPLFGIVTYGVHMTAFVRVQNETKFWIPRRAKTKQTYAGMLDNTVAGGLSIGEEPLDCLVREAAEEASFSEDLVRSSANACGVVSYFSIRDERAGGETGLLQPEVQYVYDMQIDDNVVPKPCDDEVQDFHLFSIEEVKKALAEGQFKPSCTLVLLDFFVRHGIITDESEEHYVEIISRIHRKRPFAAF